MRFLVKDAPDSHFRHLPIFGKILSIECDAVKQAWMFGGTEQECVSHTETGISSPLCPRKPSCVRLVCSLPLCMVAPTSKEQPGEPEMLTAGHVAPGSTRKTAPPHLIMNYQVTADGPMAPNMCQRLYFQCI